MQACGFQNKEATQAFTAIGGVCHRIDNRQAFKL
jgi:hypothetical protein